MALFVCSVAAQQRLRLGNRERWVVVVAVPAVVVAVAVGRAPPHPAAARPAALRLHLPQLACRLAPPRTISGHPRAYTSKPKRTFETRKTLLWTETFQNS